MGHPYGSFVGMKTPALSLQKTEGQGQGSRKSRIAERMGQPPLYCSSYPADD